MSEKPKISFAEKMRLAKQNVKGKYKRRSGSNLPIPDDITTKQQSDTQEVHENHGRNVPTAASSSSSAVNYDFDSSDDDEGRVERPIHHDNSDSDDSGSGAAEAQPQRMVPNHPISNSDGHSTTTQNIGNDDAPTHPDLVSDSDSEDDDDGENVSNTRVDSHHQERLVTSGTPPPPVMTTAVTHNVDDTAEEVNKKTGQVANMDEDDLVPAMELSDSDESSDAGYVAPSRIIKSAGVSSTSVQSNDNNIANLQADLAPPPPTPAQHIEEESVSKLEMLFPVADTANGEVYANQSQSLQAQQQEYAVSNGLDESDSETDEFIDYEASTSDKLTHEIAIESLKKLAVGGLSDEDQHAEINRVNSVLIHFKEQNDKLLQQPPVVDNSQNNKNDDFQITELQKSLQQMQSSLDTTIKEKLQLREENQKLENTVRDHERSMRSNSDGNAKALMIAQQEIEKLKQENSEAMKSLQHAIEEGTGVIKKMEEDNEKLVQESSNMTKENKEYQKSIEKLKSENTALESMRENYIEQLNEKDENLKRMKELRNDAIKERDEYLRQDADREAKLNASIQEKMAAAEASNPQNSSDDSERQQLQELEQVLMDLTQKNQQMTASVANANAERDTIIEDHEKILTEKNEALLRIDQLQSELESSDSARKDLVDKFEEMMSKNANTIEDLADEKANLEALLRSQAEEKEGLQISLEKLEDEYESAMAKNLLDLQDVYKEKKKIEVQLGGDVDSSSNDIVKSLREEIQSKDEELWSKEQELNAKDEEIRQKDNEIIFNNKKLQNYLLQLSNGNSNDNSDGDNKEGSDSPGLITSEISNHNNSTPYKRGSTVHLNGVIHPSTSPASSKPALNPVHKEMKRVEGMVKTISERKIDSVKVNPKHHLAINLSPKSKPKFGTSMPQSNNTGSGWKLPTNSSPVGRDLFVTTPSKAKPKSPTKNTSPNGTQKKSMSREARWKLLTRDAALYNYHRSILQKFLNQVKKHSMEHRMREAFIRLRFNKQTIQLMEAKSAGKKTDWDWFGLAGGNDDNASKISRRLSTVPLESSSHHDSSPQSSKPISLNGTVSITGTGRRGSTVQLEASDPHYTSPQSSKPKRDDVTNVSLTNGNAKPFRRGSTAIEATTVNTGRRGSMIGNASKSSLTNGSAQPLRRGSTVHLDTSNPHYTSPQSSKPTAKWK